MTVSNFIITCNKARWDVTHKHANPCISKNIPQLRDFSLTAQHDTTGQTHVENILPPRYRCRSHEFPNKIVLDHGAKLQERAKPRALSR